MLELRTHRFFGATSDWVVILAGIHDSEQSGVEVAHWIRVMLATRGKPTRLGAIVIPEVFADGGRAARTEEWRKGVAGLGDFRERGNSTSDVFPARHFPPPGKALAEVPGGKVTVKGRKVTMLPEIAYLIRIIELAKPVRIVSVHGKSPRQPKHFENAQKLGLISEDVATKWDGKTATKGVNFAGIFVDPRYEVTSASQLQDLEPAKFNPDEDPAFTLSGTLAGKRFDSAVTKNGKLDDALARSAAKAVKDPTLVEGNHLADPDSDGTIREVVHYAKEPGTPSGFSLGDWGPVDVHPNDTKPGSRPGAPVFTIEVKEDNESWAFLDGIQYVDEHGKPLGLELTPEQRALGKSGTKTKKFSPTRSTQLQDYAQAIINTILELP